MKTLTILGLVLFSSVAYAMPEKAVPLAPEPYPPEGTTLMAHVKVKDSPHQAEESLVLHGCIMGHVTCEGDYPAIFLSHHEATEFMPAYYSAWLIMPEQVEPFSLGAHWENVYGVRSQLSNVIHNRRTIPIITTVPEPATWLLLLFGLGGLTALWLYSERRKIRYNGAGEEIHWAGHFMPLDEIVDVVHRQIISSPDIADWIDLMESEEDLYAYHHTMGRHIRNHFGFWFEDHPYADASDPNGDNHPDQMSHEVMVRVWRKLKAAADG